MPANDPPIPRQTARWVFALAPLVLAAVVPTVVIVAVADRLPEIADGTVYDQPWSHSVLRLALLMAGAVAVAALILRLKLSPSRPLAQLTAACWMGGVMTTGSSLALIARNLDPDSRPWWTVTPVAVLGIAGAAVLAGWVASRGVPGLAEAPRSTAAAPRMDLAPHERATWNRSVFSWRTLGGYAVLLLVGVWSVIAPWVEWPSTRATLGLLVAAYALIRMTTAWARVQVDERRVVVVQPLSGRTMAAVDLGDVVEAGSRPVRDELDGRPFGVFDGNQGFGYRARPSGEMVALRLTDGREFVVTVDDAATAAALVNTLLDRREGGTDAHPDRSDVDRPVG